MADLLPTVHAVHIAHATPHIKQGFSMLTLLGTNLATGIIMAIVGWYVRGRGWFGVKTDVSNVVSAVEKIPQEVSAATAAAKAA